MKIAGKVALVTGGASGIGLGTAKRLAEEGARVVIADVDEDGGASAAADLGARFLPLDVRDPQAWQATTDRIVADEGGLDIVHLNAGVLTPVAGELGELGAQFDITELLDADYRRVTNVNIDGVVFGARAAVRAMAGRPGALVATASVAGVIPYGGDPLYAMTKHAVVGFVRSMAPLLQPRSITINAICPGVVETKISPSEAFELVRSFGIDVMQPAQIADAVVQAVTSGETGQALVCVPNKAPSKPVFPELDITGRT